MARLPMNPDLLRQIVDLYHTGLGSARIARRLGLCRQTVTYNLRRAGVTRPRPLCPARDTLERMRRDHRMSLREIGRHFGASHPTVRDWLNRHGIADPTREPTPEPPAAIPTPPAPPLPAPPPAAPACTETPATPIPPPPAAPPAFAPAPTPARARILTTIDTRNYEKRHGHPPQGRGGWSFTLRWDTGDLTSDYFEGDWTEACAYAQAAAQDAPKRAWRCDLTVTDWIDSGFG